MCGDNTQVTILLSVLAVLLVNLGVHGVRGNVSAIDATTKALLQIGSNASQVKRLKSLTRTLSKLRALATENLSAEAQGKPP